jgi:septation ring formation regulator EzrA
MKVAEAMANKVKAKATENAQKRAEQVYRQTETVAQTLDSGMAKEIQSVREQVETVLAAKQAGEASVQATQKALAEAEGQLQQIETAVCDMILTVAGLPAK